MTPSRSLALLAAIGLVLVATTWVGQSLHLGIGDIAFSALAVAQGLMVLLALRLALRCPPGPALAVIAVVAVALRLVVLPVDPHLSTDAYRYVWDGRVQAAGINPYRYIPTDPALEALRDAAIFPNINRADYAPTIYPPAAQMLFQLVARISDTLLAMRLAFVLCEVVIVAVLFDLLRRIRQPAVRVLAYAWHPLAVWEIAGSGHLDAAMIAMMMSGIWIALVAGRRLLAAAVLAVAALVKPPAAIALAVTWRAWDWRAPALAIAVAVALYLPYLSVGSGVLGFLPGYLGEERIATAEGFWMVSLLKAQLGPLRLATPIYLALAVGIVGALALRVALHTDRTPEAVLTRLCWAVFAFVFLLSPDYPWYWLILLPFVALTGFAPGWAATIGAFVLYDVIDEGFEVDFMLRDTALHLAILATLPLALRRRRAAHTLATSGATP
ncbi:glycosyltransferase 87 family protein [Elioraea sp.]|uniref:glycosyltransferase 87 family protein n=1 Tax=Elioraea sp. TaxID=2185103 RepID=UPI0025C57311|nr:glycosyltransferase 87 family protein [Elioraea sp.]